MVVKFVLFHESRARTCHSCLLVMYVDTIVACEMEPWHGTEAVSTVRHRSGKGRRHPCGVLACFWPNSSNSGLFLGDILRNFLARTKCHGAARGGGRVPAILVSNFLWIVSAHYVIILAYLFRSSANDPDRKLTMASCAKKLLPTLAVFHLNASGCDEDKAVEQAVLKVMRDYAPMATANMLASFVKGAIRRLEKMNGLEVDEEEVKILCGILAPA